MMQQVNLYRHLDGKTQDKSALNSYLYGSALFVVLFTGDEHLFFYRNEADKK